MKYFLKFGVALVLFGLLLSVLGVGIIRAHAVKPALTPIPVPVVAASSNASASTPALP
jgi:hypothetical protein